MTTLANTTTHEIFELLSNNDYILKVTYTYDLNDGVGNRELVKELTAKTDAKTAPSFTVKNETITTESIHAEYDITDVDSILSYYKIELYKGDSLVKENTDQKIIFTGLNYYNDYTVRFTYRYNLNDGNGEQTATYDYTFKTLPYIDVTECSVANTSAVSEGETIFMSVKLDNPLGMTIESVVINGKTYGVTGSSTKNKIFVEIVYNGQFAGGDTYLKIDRINTSIDSKTFVVEPKTILSDNIFINGKLEVLKVEYVNEDFEPIEWTFPSDTVYVLITLDNPTGYIVDNVNTTITELHKIDHNRWYYVTTLSDGWNAESLNSISYHNEHIEKTTTCSDIITASCFRVASDEIKYISTPDDLKNMSDGYYYELKNDIDLSGMEWLGNEFWGVFDGKGYAIKNMSFVGTIKNTEAHLGLFSRGSGVIRNVNIEEATIIAEITAESDNIYSAYAGGFVAYTIGDLHLHNCTVDEYSVLTVKNVSGKVNIGGLVGYVEYNTITITHCTNGGDISVTTNSGDYDYADAYAGGLVGYVNHYTTIAITNCTNSGGISVTTSSGDDADAYTGGLVGYVEYNTTITITHCTNSGDISATSNCGYTFVAGLVGLVNHSAIITITNCTNNGDISATSNSSLAYAGGLVGYVGNDVIIMLLNCISSGYISATTGNFDSYAYAGGLIGNVNRFATDTITNCYSITTGNGYNGDSCTTEQLNSKDFYIETLGWSEDVWDFSELDIENGKYPQLKY